jgi:trimeric autotransporter adhesin
MAGEDGTTGYSGDGSDDATTGATFNSPEGVDVDANGNIYIADTGNNVVREVTPSGYVSTVAGDGIAGYSGDGGLATSAELNAPWGVAVDTNDNLYIADTGNNVIRVVSPIFHYITTVAGNGTAGYTGDGGQATSAELNAPIGVWADDYGDFSIADYVDNVIRQVAPDGTITTVDADMGPPTNGGP